MITSEQIWKTIEEEKLKCKPDTDAQYELQQKVNDALAKFAISVDEGDEATAMRLRDEVKKLKEQLAEVEDLNLSKDSGAFAAALRTHGKLGKMCKQFETETLAAAEPLLQAETELSNKVTESYNALLEAIKTMRGKRQELAHLLSPLDGLREYTPAPHESTNGSIYQHFKNRMTQFNFQKMGNDLRRAMGEHFVPYP